MSIIVLTPKPKVPNATAVVADTHESLAARVASDFLHLMGQDGYRFDSFEQLRDFAQAQIDAVSVSAAAVTHAAQQAAAEAVVEPVTGNPPVAGDATNAVSGQAAQPESVIILTPPPPTAS